LQEALCKHSTASFALLSFDLLQLQCLAVLLVVKAVQKQRSSHCFPAGQPETLAAEDKQVVRDNIMESLIRWAGMYTLSSSSCKTDSCIQAVTALLSRRTAAVVPVAPGGRHHHQQQ
jgi:hypothetical protein